MDPGELDKLIKLVRLVETGQSGTGQPIKERQTIAEPWAKAIYPSGREFLQGDGKVTERRVVFRIWARDDVDTDNIVEFAGVDHEIQHIEPYDDVTVLHTVSKAPKAQP